MLGRRYEIDGFFPMNCRTLGSRRWGGGGFTQAVGYQTSPDNSGAFGWFKVCVNDGFYGWGENANVYPAYGPNAQGQYYWEWYNYHLGGHGMVNTIYCFN